MIDKALGREFWAIPIPASQLHSPEMDFPGNADRRRLQIAIENQHLSIGDGPTDRHQPPAIGAIALPGGDVDCCFRRPVKIVQANCRESLEKSFLQIPRIALRRCK